jgi:hypothetical protein
LKRKYPVIFFAGKYPLIALMRLSSSEHVVVGVVGEAINRDVLVKAGDLKKMTSTPLQSCKIKLASIGSSK